MSTFTKKLLLARIANLTDEETRDALTTMAMNLNANKTTVVKDLEDALENLTPGQSAASIKTDEDDREEKVKPEKKKKVKTPKKRPRADDSDSEDRPQTPKQKLKKKHKKEKGSKAFVADLASADTASSDESSSEDELPAPHSQQNKKTKKKAPRASSLKSTHDTSSSDTSSDDEAPAPKPKHKKRRKEKESKAAATVKPHADQDDSFDYSESWASTPKKKSKKLKTNWAKTSKKKARKEIEVNEDAGSHKAKRNDKQKVSQDTNATENGDLKTSKQKKKKSKTKTAQITELQDTNSPQGGPDVGTHQQSPQQQKNQGQGNQQRHTQQEVLPGEHKQQPNNRGQSSQGPSHQHNNAQQQLNNQQQNSQQQNAQQGHTSNSSHSSSGQYGQPHNAEPETPCRPVERAKASQSEVVGERHTAPGPSNSQPPLTRSQLENSRSGSARDGESCVHVGAHVGAHNSTPTLYQIPAWAPPVPNRQSDHPPPQPRPGPPPSSSAPSQNAEPKIKTEPNLGDDLQILPNTPTHVRRNPFERNPQPIASTSSQRVGGAQANHAPTTQQSNHRLPQQREGPLDGTCKYCRRRYTFSTNKVGACPKWWHPGYQVTLGGIQPPYLAGSNKPYQWDCCWRPVDPVDEHYNGCAPAQHVWDGR